MKRIAEIDLAKGIAIIMVVLGHSYTSRNVITQIIYSFHMPFFFIVSGILYRIRYDIDQDITFGFRKKAQRLLLPWVVWGGIYQLFISCLKIIGGASIIDQIKVGATELVELGLGSVWFLPALYIASAIILNIRNSKKRYVVIVACLMIGLFVPGYTGITNTLLRTAAACGFVGIGFLGAHMFMKRVGVYGNIICMCVLVGLALSNGAVSMYSREFGYPIVFFVTGVLGTYLLLSFCNWIKNYQTNILVQELKMYGEKSIIILCMHKFVIEIVRLIDYKLFNNVLMALGIFEGIILTILVMFILTLGFPFIEKYLNGTLGINLKG